MVKCNFVLSAVLFSVSHAHADKKLTSSYDDVALVTNTIAWPYDHKHTERTLFNWATPIMPILLSLIE
jgi:hypothetical protein